VSSLLAVSPLLERMRTDGHEQVVHCQDGATGLRAIVAIHSTVLGPGLGGTRFYPYPDEEAALTDVLRLSRAMTYKNAAAGLDYGGGKAVIIGDPATIKSEALLRAYGRFLDGLGGRYLTAEDIGTTQADMDIIRRETVSVTGIDPLRGGSGDPSLATAWGVRCAMAAVAEALGAPLAGLRVVVSGVGKVGSALVGHLLDDGAVVTVADVSPAAVARARWQGNVTVVSSEDALRTECDVFSPCAMGAVLSAESIPGLACRAVVGAANNQLAAPGDAVLLERRGIVYAPDYVVNAGGVINLAEEPGGYDRERAWTKVAAVADTVRKVLADASAQGITTAEAADKLAERRMAAVGGVQHLGPFPTRAQSAGRGGTRST
jgi:valine dehydrogenase (NAD+)